MNTDALLQSIASASRDGDFSTSYNVILASPDAYIGELISALVDEKNPRKTLQALRLLTLISMQTNVFLSEETYTNIFQNFITKLPPLITNKKIEENALKIASFFIAKLVVQHYEGSPRNKVIQSFLMANIGNNDDCDAFFTRTIIQILFLSKGMCNIDAKSILAYIQGDNRLFQKVEFYFALATKLNEGELDPLFDTFLKHVDHCPNKIEAIRIIHCTVKANPMFFSKKIEKFVKFLCKHLQNETIDVEKECCDILQSIGEEASLAKSDAFFKTTLDILIDLLNSLPEDSYIISLIKSTMRSIIKANSNLKYLNQLIAKVHEKDKNDYLYGTLVALSYFSNSAYKTLNGTDIFQCFFSVYSHFCTTRCKHIKIAGISACSKIIEPCLCKCIFENKLYLKVLCNLSTYMEYIEDKDVFIECFNIMMILLKDERLSLDVETFQCVNEKIWKIARIEEDEDFLVSIFEVYGAFFSKIGGVEELHDDVKFIESMEFFIEKLHSISKMSGKAVVLQCIASFVDQYFYEKHTETRSMVRDVFDYIYFIMKNEKVDAKTTVRMYKIQTYLIDFLHEDMGQILYEMLNEAIDHISKRQARIILPINEKIDTEEYFCKIVSHDEVFCIPKHVVNMYDFSVQRIKKLIARDEINIINESMRILEAFYRHFAFNEYIGQIRSSIWDCMNAILSIVYSKNIPKAVSLFESMMPFIQCRFLIDEISTYEFSVFSSIYNITKIVYSIVEGSDEYLNKLGGFSILVKPSISRYMETIETYIYAFEIPCLECNRSNLFEFDLADIKRIKEIVYDIYEKNDAIDKLGEVRFSFLFL